MKRNASGTHRITVTGDEKVVAFVPMALPPERPLELGGARQLLLERATLAVGRLDSISTLLPDSHVVLYSYVRREAVLSSQIEESNLPCPKHVSVLTSDTTRPPGLFRDFLSRGSRVELNCGNGPASREVIRGSSILSHGCSPAGGRELEARSPPSRSF